MARTHRFMRSGQQKFRFHGWSGAGYLIGNLTIGEARVLAPTAKR